MSDRPRLVVDRLREALNAAGPLEKLTDEQLDSVIDSALPEVPEEFRVDALEFICEEREKKMKEETLGTLAAWQPTPEELARPQ